MTFSGSLTTKRALAGYVCAGALVTVACADGQGTPISPSASAAPSVLAATTPRSGDLLVTKDCKDYTGAAGSFCTITSSNLKALEAGSRVVYSQAAGATALDSEVVIHVGPGNTVFGRCRLEFATGLGQCTFTGGTGKFQWFHATEDVSYLGGTNWGWDGSYYFSPRD